MLTIIKSIYLDLTTFLNITIVVLEDSSKVNLTENSNSDEVSRTYLEYFCTFFTESNCDILFNYSMLFLTAYLTYKKYNWVKEAPKNDVKSTDTDSVSSESDINSGNDPNFSDLPDSSYNPLKLFLGFVDTIYTILFG